MSDEKGRTRIRARNSLGKQKLISQRQLLLLLVCIQNFKIRSVLPSALFVFVS